MHPPTVQEAAPLGTVLTSVGASKPAILAAIDALEAEPPVGGGTERMLGDALRAVLRWVASGAQQAAEEALQERHALQQGQQQAAQQGQEAVAPQQQQWERPAGQTRAEPAGSGVSELPAAQGFPGMRLLLFLSGPPNCGAGSVVKRQQVQPVAAAQSHAAVEEAAKELAYLVLDPAYPELSAWTDGAAAEVRARAAATAEAAAAVQAAAGNLSHAAPPGVPAEALAVDLAAAQFYAEAGAAAAALGISVDLFAACPHWMGGWRDCVLACHVSTHTCALATEDFCKKPILSVASANTLLSPSHAARRPGDDRAAGQHHWRHPAALHVLGSSCPAPGAVSTPEPACLPTCTSSVQPPTACLM